MDPVPMPIKLEANTTKADSIDQRLSESRFSHISSMTFGRYIAHPSGLAANASMRLMARTSTPSIPITRNSIRVYSSTESMREVSLVLRLLSTAARLRSTPGLPSEEPHGLRYDYTGWFACSVVAD